MNKCGLRPRLELGLELGLGLGLELGLGLGPGLLGGASEDDFCNAAGEHMWTSMAGRA